MPSEPGGADPHADPSGLAITWSPAHQPAWDDDPGQYFEHNIVAWGRSRRLARAADPARAFKAYAGVQHYDPGRWHVPGPARSVYFLSLFVAGRTITLRTFPTLSAALTALRDFHARLPTRQ
jgi:hypothetical protein